MSPAGLKTRQPVRYNHDTILGGRALLENRAVQTMKGLKEITSPARTLDLSEDVPKRAATALLYQPFDVIVSQEKQVPASRPEMSGQVYQGITRSTKATAHPGGSTGV